MSYESEEQVKLRTRRNRIEHSQRLLEGARKTLSKKQIDEYNDLVNNKIDRDPYVQISLRESVLARLRNVYVMQKGGGGTGITYTDLVNHLLCKIDNR